MQKQCNIYSINCILKQHFNRENNKRKKRQTAINMIKYDNDYYYIDATWGDLVLDDEEIINNN